jgi:hypothetical protein
LELKRAGKDPRIGPTVFPSVPYPDPVIVAPPWEGGDGNASKGHEKTRIKAGAA